MERSKGLAVLEAGRMCQSTVSQVTCPGLAWPHAPPWHSTDVAMASAGVSLAKYTDVSQTRHLTSPWGRGCPDRRICWLLLIQSLQGSQVEGRSCEGRDI